MTSIFQDAKPLKIPFFHHINKPHSNAKPLGKLSSKLYNPFFPFYKL
jgi:hypothetical protein